MLNFTKVANGEEGPPVSKEKVTEFLAENPNPDDSEVHAWTEGQGKDVHATEENISSTLIDYGQPQAGKLHSLLDKGMSANNNIYLPVPDFLLEFLLPCLFDITDEQCHGKGTG